MTRRLRLADCDSRDFRDALGCFATGVTVVTAPGAEPGSYIGVTANSFASVSLDPPLVLFSLGRHTRSLAAFQDSRHFAVNVLSSKQDALSHRFARTATDKWSGLAYELWEHDCPILPGCVASFECAVHATHDGGDHVIFLGRVVHMSCDPEAEPLLFLQGRYGTFGEAR